MRARFPRSGRFTSRACIRRAAGSFPGSDYGLFSVTGQSVDLDRFKAPTLRNIDRSAPYMHDGSLATLGDVIDFYAAGGRVVAAGSRIGDGRAHPGKSPFIKGFTLTPEERHDLLAFLASLTDAQFLADPRFSDPGVARSADRDLYSASLYGDRKSVV